MQTLTAAERETLRHLRGRNARWRIARWLAIACGVGLSALGAVLVYRAVRNIDSVARGPSDVAIPLASMLTTQLVLAVIIFLVGGGIVVWVVGRWRGNPVHQLLLKLFEEEANV
jgi:hypothetical protein